jgi:hypothetical protein
MVQSFAAGTIHPTTIKQAAGAVNTEKPGRRQRGQWGRTTFVIAETELKPYHTLKFLSCSAFLGPFFKYQIGILACRAIPLLARNSLQLCSVMDRQFRISGGCGSFGTARKLMQYVNLCDSAVQANVAGWRLMASAIA